MSGAFQPWEFLLLAVAGGINRHQQAVIDYLIEENRVLKEQLRGKRPYLTDDQRRRLTAKGKALGRRILRAVASLVTTDNILAWHRKLIAWKWDFSSRRKKPRRPPVMREIAELVVRAANRRW